MKLSRVGSWLAAFFIFTPIFSFSQVKTFDAIPSSSAPVIDGNLDDEAWSRLNNGLVFTEFSPNNGQRSEFRTAVDIVYTDKGIYVAAKLYDDQPDQILQELGARDDDGKNADEFGILLDTYNNGQNAFFFKVSAAGVQTDIYYSGGGRDRNWDAVWKSAVKIDEDGWNVEIEIPYYAIRFAKQKHQVWGLNLYRNVQRMRQTSYWNPVDNAVRGLVNQSGKLVGLKNIEPPLRLSFSPYITALYDHSAAAAEGKASISGGMDLKYGINESFTLDVSLIPDFSQVRSDDQVLNLSPFEVRFSENRPFFTENTDIFNRGGLFYSRRVGQSKGLVFETGDEDEVISTPGNAPLINATKLSGRTKKGTGIGFFNGLTRKTYAEVDVPDLQYGKVYDEEQQDSIYAVYNREEVLYDPLTNYNVLVVDQNLKNNSSIGVINTSVIRSDGGRDANVSSADASIYDKTNTYRVGARVAISSIFDTDSEGEKTTDVGHRYAASFSKVSGTWQYSVSRNVESDNYRINDMGFIRSNNELSHSARLSYNIFQPFSIFNDMRHRVYFNHSLLYKPREFVTYNVGYNGDAQFKNFWGVGYGVNFIPEGENDFFESRNELPFVQPWAWNFNLRMYTDSRKPLFFNVWGGRWFRPEWSQKDLYMGAFSRLRVNDKLSVTYNVSRSESLKDIGYVSVSDEVRENENISEEATVFGGRDIVNTENRLGLNYTFTNKIALNARVRHLWSKVSYEDFYQLNEDGSLTEEDYNGEDSDGVPNHDINFNAFNVDLNFSWQVAPGSFFTVAWRNASLFSTEDTETDFAKNFQQVIDQPHSNSLSFRLTYFIDYMTLRRSI
ncbi:hypothetical protein E1176_06900 [Fulvivirga sp. RKSG066]|uniref:DUF5916 domain-containing protein n=1 Tax=Fulvivirga aurantia TaxID=2529383 RepID=UPI0012BCCF15|nr:DUF5916 domain-containing protein [Fulvivirga aurantia]MTI20743.1 hypothetical protein [Fulvivirga aurantia]